MRHRVLGVTLWYLVVLPAYLASTSAAVVKGIQNQQPQGKWLMQGWLFHSEFWTDNVSRIKACVGWSTA